MMHDEDDESEADIHISTIRVSMPCAECGKQHEFIASEKEYNHLMSGSMLIRLCFTCRWS